MHIVIRDRPSPSTIDDRCVRRVAQLHLQPLIALHQVVLPYLHRHRPRGLSRPKGQDRRWWPQRDRRIVARGRRRLDIERPHLHGDSIRSGNR